MSEQAEKNYKKFGGVEYDKFDKKADKFTYYDMIGFADEHHKEQLEKKMPSDREIRDKFNHRFEQNRTGKKRLKEQELGAKWLKYKLLKTIEK